jgi:hypothetical protein
VFVWAVTRALWLTLLNVDAMGTQLKSETFPSMSVGCILGSSHCLLSLLSHS